MDEELGQMWVEKYWPHGEGGARLEGPEAVGLWGLEGGERYLPAAE